MYKTIGIVLDDVIKDIDFEKKVLEKLKECSKFSLHVFKVILFHRDISVKEIKAFVKRNTENLFNINVDITKQFNKRAFFMIRSYYNIIDNYRYLYVGNILDGLDQYIILMQNIKRRENRRNVY
tara:strand:- start:231 stop:602 length:372 start_codon:yes stop_codon:yes gene_type:complete